jgi:hypothetical protein
MSVYFSPATRGQKEVAQHASQMPKEINNNLEFLWVPEIPVRNKWEITKFENRKITEKNQLYKKLMLWKKINDIENF